MESLRNKIKEVQSFLKYLYLVLILSLTLYAIIELKHIYRIDVFPGVDTPFDNVYYKLINPTIDDYSQNKV